MRIFIAIELPQETKNIIEKFKEEIKKSIPLRFVALENLHLTLFFLGEVTGKRVGDVVEVVKNGVKEIKPFFLFLEKPGFFSHGLWINIGGQVDILNKLYKQIKKELETRNFQVEERPFRAHITIGRSKSKSKRLEFREIIRAKFKVESVVVFKSSLTSDGPIYSKITSILLEEKNV